MKKMLSLTAAVATLISCPDAHAQSSSFDVLFEANGTTYTLYSQSFPLELSVDEWSWGSFRDIFDSLYMVASLDHFVASSEWLSQTGDEATLDSAPGGGFTLTISRPFTGTIDMNGEYEYQGSTYEWDPEIGDYVETPATFTESYCISISVPGYEPEPELSAIVATSGDVGKVIGANGRLYWNAEEATTSGTTAEAMIAYLDMTNRTGLAIALADAGTRTRIREAADTVANGWAPNHNVAHADWRLPSLADWRLIFAGCGGENPDSALTANTAYNAGSIGEMLQTAGGTAFSSTDPYASSTGEGSQTWCFDFHTVTFLKIVTTRGIANVRACLAFDFQTPYDTWAATNNLGAADAVTDGTPNLIRYVFNCPTNACNPFVDISFNAQGRPVVQTLAPVNTDGVSISLLSSTNLTSWADADVLYPEIGLSGELVFEHNTDAPSRFYRLKVEE